MVDVGVRKHDGGYIAAVKREIPVALGCFLTAALKLAAVEQVVVVSDGELVHGTGHGLSRAPKCKLHPLKDTDFALVSKNERRVVEEN